mgnify:CR=1 FL=1
MCEPDSAESGVLPFDQSDVVNGVGPIDSIVSLSGYTDKARNVHEGVCNYCGYDRGTLKGHTEIAVRGLHCRNCEAKLGEWE